MKIIFFLRTVDIFWVLESWVMKKLLGPNGRAKTQFSRNQIQKQWGAIPFPSPFPPPFLLRRTSSSFPTCFFSSTISTIKIIIINLLLSPFFEIFIFIFVFYTLSYMERKGNGGKEMPCVWIHLRAVTFQLYSVVILFKFF